jgi:hypothetical protein
MAAVNGTSHSLVHSKLNFKCQRVYPVKAKECTLEFSAKVFIGCLLVRNNLMLRPVDPTLPVGNSHGT